MKNTWNTLLLHYLSNGAFNSKSADMPSVDKQFFANRCPSPADKIFSRFVVIKNFLLFMEGGGGGGGGGFVEGQIQTSSLPYSRLQTIFSFLSPFNLSEIKILGIVA